MGSSPVLPAEMVKDKRPAAEGGAGPGGHCRARQRCDGAQDQGGVYLDHLMAVCVVSSEEPRVPGSYSSNAVCFLI